MRASRWGIILWTVLIAVLLFVEVAEITHVFTLPIQSAIGDPLAFVFALVFTTILALVGAVYIGIYVSARVLRTQGFTPFEEEMLKMRGEIRDIKASVDRLAREDDRADDPPERPPSEGSE
jgi:membrane protein implicated in regulation of membrane protease activity